MKILIVSPRFPYAQGKADSMTVFYLIKYLSEQGHQVLLATFHNNENFPEEERELIKERCLEVKTTPIKKWKIGLNLGLNIIGNKPFQNLYYWDEEMQSNIDELIEKHQPDVIYGHLIRVSEYIKNVKNIPTVLAMQIAQTLNYNRLIKHERKLARKLFYAEECRRVTQFEPKITHHFDRILLISPHDKKAIFPNANGKPDHIFFNPHGIDVSYFGEHLNLKREENTIVITGDFGVPTNIDAAHYFYNKIYPTIKKEVPDVKLWFVGRNPAPSIQSLREDSSVTVTGKVKDIRPYLQRATVGIAPLRAAAGLQNKILVSLASRLPMVVTKVANEGIGAPENQVLLVAKDNEDYAEKIIHLFKNNAERERLGANALKFMQQSWTWEFHFQKLERMLSQLIENQNKPVENYYPFSYNEIN